MHDAIVLANLINALPDHPIASEIENAFQAYKDERISWAKDAYNSSKSLRDMTATVSLFPERNTYRNRV